MKGGLLKLVRGQRWLIWLGISAAVHAVAALSVGGLGTSITEIAVAEAREQPPIRVAFLAPPRPTVAEKAADPPSILATREPSPEVIPEREAVEESDPVEESELEKPEPPDPEPPEPDEPAERVEPEKPAAQALPIPDKLQPSGAAVEPEELAGGQLRERGPATVVNPAPRYPRPAIVRGWSGTVWVEVTLCSRGHPQTGTVVESSGHPLLDRQARRTILREWRFESGQPGRTALVRIQFDLQ
jgi:protein TonB